MSITQIVGLAVGIRPCCSPRNWSAPWLLGINGLVSKWMWASVRVGTFGVLTHVSPQTSPLPSTGSAGRSLIVIFGLALFLATGIAVKIAWDKTHPDIRSAYGRAYERCLRQGVSRWNVQSVDLCVEKGRSSWN